MKHKGAMMEYASERTKDLMRAYHEHIASCRRIYMPDVYQAIVNMRSKRFWVSELRAKKVVGDMLRGIPITGMRPSKREMFEEIFKRVMQMKSEFPERTVAICCEMVVAQPAPKFYLEPGSAKIIVCKARKKWAAERMKRFKNMGGHRK